MLNPKTNFKNIQLLISKSNCDRNVSIVLEKCIKLHINQEFEMYSEAFLPLN